MAYQKNYCANANCPKNTIYSGVTFVFSREDGKMYCEDCFHIKPVLNSCKNLWDFTTTHFNGQPIRVEGGYHLDALCKQYGVSNHARENMERNWNTPPPVKPHPVDRELLSRLDGRNYS